MLGEAAFGVLREDQLVVDEDVELALTARRRVRVVTGQSVDLGRETRGPGVVAVSGGAIEDTDRAHEPLIAAAPVTNGHEAG